MDRDTLDSKTVKELRQLASAAELTGYSKLKKAELVDALADELPASPDRRRPKVAAVPDTMREAAEATAEREGDLTRTREPAVVPDRARKIAAATAEQEARVEGTTLRAGNVAGQVARAERE